MQTEEIRRGLAHRLRERRLEIEEAVLTRVYGVADPAGARDPIYVKGLRTAVSAAIGYGLEAVERSGGRAPPIPTQLLSQARLAARNGVSLDTVLRRYFAGYALLGDFLVEESGEAGRLNGASLKRLLRDQASLFDRVMAVVAEEYGREETVRSASTEERQAERVRRLLAGEFLDTTGLGYDFEAHHLGLVVCGQHVAPLALRDLAVSLDRRLLLARPNKEITWAWLGGRRALDPETLLHAIEVGRPAACSVALGEPAEGVSGWRLTHRQATAALSVREYTERSVLRYRDVTFLAAAARDELLTASLHQLYLEPLEVGRESGDLLRRTLRAYFDAGRNVSSAAAGLGVSRQTVGSRLRAVEVRLGKPLDQCASELDIALRLAPGLPVHPNR